MIFWNGTELINGVRTRVILVEVACVRCQVRAEADCPDCQGYGGHLLTVSDPAALTEEFLALKRRVALMLEKRRAKYEQELGAVVEQPQNKVKGRGKR